MSKALKLAASERVRIVLSCLIYVPNAVHGKITAEDLSASSKARSIELGAYFEYTVSFLGQSDNRICYSQVKNFTCFCRTASAWILKAFLRFFVVLPLEHQVPFRWQAIFTARWDSNPR